MQRVLFVIFYNSVALHPHPIIIYVHTIPYTYLQCTILQIILPTAQKYYSVFWYFMLTVVGKVLSRYTIQQQRHICKRKYCKLLTQILLEKNRKQRRKKTIFLLFIMNVGGSFFCRRHY